MTSTKNIVVALTIATGLAAVCLNPVRAQTAKEALTASAAPTLDLSTGSDIAIKAARAAQSGEAAESPKPAPAVTSDTLAPVTVTPQTEVKGRVVASTDARSLASPRFSANDVSEPILAVSAGRNTAMGQQSVDNTHTGGFLAVNPQGDATRSTVGFTRVF